MKPHSPRQTLIDQTPLERCEEKRVLALAWIGLHGHTIEPLIMALLKIKGRGFCARLEKEGLLRRAPLHLAKNLVWTLTRAGVRHASGALMREIDFSAHPERISLWSLQHSMAVQRCQLASCDTSWHALTETRGDRELRSLPYAARPDLQVRSVSQSGRLVYDHIEVELTQKSSTELQAKYLAMLPLVAKGVRWAWYVAAGRAAVDRYQRVWRESVERHGDGFGVERPVLLDQCSFRAMPVTRV